MSRTLKQFIYGLGFLSFLGVIGGSVYLISSHKEISCFDNIQNGKEEQIDCGGTCITCELKNLKLINQGPRFFFQEDKTTFLVEINNPSKNYGSRKFDYSLEILGPFGTVTKTVNGVSSINSRESKYIIVPAVQIDSKDIASVKFSANNLNWEPTNSLPKHALEVKNISSTQVDNLFRVSGLIYNNSSENIISLKVSAILFDKTGNMVNVSQTEAKNIGGFNSSNFIVFFPKISLEKINTSKTKVFLDVTPQ